MISFLYYLQEAKKLGNVFHMTLYDGAEKILESNTLKQHQIYRDSSLKRKDSMHDILRQQYRYGISVTRDFFTGNDQ